MASASSTMLKTCWAADVVGYVMLVSLFRSFEIAVLQGADDILAIY